MLKVFIVLADAENTPASEYERTLVKLHKWCELCNSDLMLPVEKDPGHTQNHIPLSLVYLNTQVICTVY